MNVSADWWIFCPTDCTDYTDGGPQADEADERESSEFKRNLNGGPQADGFVGKQQLSSIGQQLKEKFFLIAVILQVIAVQEKELVVCGLQLP